MTLKSNIDWNEIIPLLPSKKREDLYLEAVTLLSQQDREREKTPQPTRKYKSSRKERQWTRDGDGHALSAPGRKYKINKKAKYIPRDGGGAFKKLWDKLVESHNDLITYEGVYSIWHGIAKTKEYPVSTVIAQLWAKRMIDVAENKVVATEPAKA